MKDHEYQKRYPAGADDMEPDMLMQVVHEHPNGDDVMVVELKIDIMNEAEYWGQYLARVAQAIVEQYELQTLHREDGDVLAAIRDGFNCSLAVGSATCSHPCGVPRPRRPRAGG